jgi:hypothetical protein
VVIAATDLGKKMADKTPYKYADWPAHSWDKIEENLKSNFLGQFIKMLDLVQHIKKTGASTRLYGLTSMDKLIVSVYDKIDPYKEALHISYNLPTNKWHFEYRAKPFQDPEFERTYEADIGIQKFDDFLKKVNW